MSGDIWKPVGREGELQYCALNPCLCYLHFPHKLSPVNLPLPSQISPSVLFFSLSQANSYVNYHF